MPIEPEPSRWQLPRPELADRFGIVGVGADLEPGTLLAAYRSGLFPMPVEDPQVAWWSPDPRGIIEPSALRISRSLRASRRRYTVTVDAEFESVIDACRLLPRPHGWISPHMRDAYVRLHRLGWAHSVETWRQGQLVGGLYGVAIGSFFAGESMFHRARDGSKVALVGLVELLSDAEDPLLDVQWVTPHLASLGATEISRTEYLRRLERALRTDQPADWDRPEHGQQPGPG